MDRPQLKTAAVVVNHDAGEALVDCVESLFADGAEPVVVVDNCSGDGSAETLARKVPSARLVRIGKNLGYGAGANRGLSASRDSGEADGSPRAQLEEMVLVANADVVVHRGAIDALVEALRRDPGLALAGPRILEPDGSRYPSARRFPSIVDAAGHSVLGSLAPGNRFTRRYRMTDLDATSAVTEVDWVSGAIFAGRRRALEELGGFDESYFMYAEDMDLCWRARQTGWGVAYVPGAAVTHLRGVSTAKAPYRMLVEHHRSALRFASRMETGWRRPLLIPAAALLGLRLAAELARTALSQRASRAGGRFPPS